MTRLYRVVSLAELQDLTSCGEFRQGPNSMSGKWFADSLEGVLRHAAVHYTDGSGRIVAIEVSERLLNSAFRLPNLDGFGPATYLTVEELSGVVPLLEVDNVS